MSFECPSDLLWMSFEWSGSSLKKGGFLQCFERFFARFGGLGVFFRDLGGLGDFFLESSRDSFFPWGLIFFLSRKF